MTDPGTDTGPSRSDTGPPGPTGTDRSGHPGVARVLAVLAAHGITPDVRHLPDAVRTARAAADALGTTPGEIANSILLRARTLDGDDLPLLVITSGGHQVDLEKVATLSGLADVALADPEFVRQHTGFDVGGVAPVGHTSPVRTIVDVTLTRYPVVWAAAGHSHSVFATTYDELLRITGGQPMEVT